MFGFSRAGGGDGDQERGRLDEIHFVGLPPDLEEILRKKLAGAMEAAGRSGVKFVSRDGGDSDTDDSGGSRQQVMDEMRQVSAKAAIVAMAREMWTTLVLRDLYHAADALDDTEDDGDSYLKGSVHDDDTDVDDGIVLDEERVAQYAKATMKACAIFLREAEQMEVKVVGGGM